MKHQPEAAAHSPRAMGGVTNALVNAASLAGTGERHAAPLTDLAARHRATVDALLSPTARHDLGAPGVLADIHRLSSYLGAHLSA